MRFLRSLLALSSAGAVALAAAPLWAAEAEKANAGLPQFDSSLYAGQLFWLVITFAALYLILSRLAIPSVAQVQKKRQAAIAAELARANTANEAAKKIIAEYEKILVDARTKAATNDTAVQAAKESMERQAEQKKELARRVHQAEVRIATAREAAMRDIETAAQEIAGNIVEQLVGTKLQVKS